ncbi:hypothetical protein E0485_07225 [Paenibacillus albiflavus]|uniref:Uncharacterized protein n=1 Tax=Paenibacillus albiflavus TaxID=2545760 RepID=A0A4R4EFL3_9BACL|nr:DUF6483 family protein [Paenibacillus albiflavus]TCZ78856.1 hypothetical protein E0485_07225 [Paenibacillus albiflavus]
MSRDYLLRQIEQLTAVLSTILGLKKEQKPELALQTIEEYLKRELGLSSKLLNNLHAEELIRMCNTDSLTGRDKLYTLATLLKEEGELQRMTGNEATADERSFKSLYLMLAYSALPSHDHETQLTEMIASLLASLQHCELPTEASALLFQYYERKHQYAAAEDVLFDRLQAEAEFGTNPSELMDLVAEGNAFYQRLLKCDDEDLLQGNLPRSEIWGALDELKRFTVRET